MSCISTISGNCPATRQLPLEAGVADHLVAGLDGGGLAFDVSEDVGDLGYVVAHVGFEFGDLVVGGLQGKVLIEFDMLLDVEMAVEILHADVVDVEVVASSDGPNAVEDVFRTLGARERLNGDIGVGEDAMNCLGYGFDQLLRALKCNSAGKADREIGEIAVAGAADAHPPDFEHAIHARDGVDNLSADSSGSGVKQSVGSAPRQAPAHGNDDASDEQGSDGIGKAKPIQMIDAPQQD